MVIWCETEQTEPPLWRHYTDFAVVQNSRIFAPPPVGYNDLIENDRHIIVWFPNGTDRFISRNRNPPWVEWAIEQKLS